MTLGQAMLPGLAHYTLDGVASALRLPDFRHHRAVDDAEVVAQIIEALFARLRGEGVRTLAQINDHLKAPKVTLRALGRNFAPHHSARRDAAGTVRPVPPYQAFLTSTYYHRHPLLPRHWLERLRSGLIIGSACESGELFSAVVSGAGSTELRRIASKYDYLEIQPVCNNAFLIGEGKAASDMELQDFNRKIIKLGEELNLPVVGTGDVHFLDPNDEIYRRILLAGNGFKDADRDLPLYFRSTADMLSQFEYLGEEKAREVVVTNPNALAERIEALQPVPTGLFPPTIENSREELETLVWSRARELYGDAPPRVVCERLEAELKDIIGCNYDVIYISASRLVRRSNEAGYLVGSRGSVGSSLVAYMAGITEVNALGPHYRCPNCRSSEFISDPEYGCGADLPDKLCPDCGAPYDKDGFSIPFETFLGYGGDKVPDIDLNFSGEYQAQAHRNVADPVWGGQMLQSGDNWHAQREDSLRLCKKIPRGEKPALHAERGKSPGHWLLRRQTHDRTGQHPGGIVVIPRDKEIYYFCPRSTPRGR